jgi:hypothetical protein
VLGTNKKSPEFPKGDRGYCLQGKKEMAETEKVCDSGRKTVKEQ